MELLFLDQLMIITLMKVAVEVMMFEQSRCCQLAVGVGCA